VCGRGLSLCGGLLLGRLLLSGCGIVLPRVWSPCAGVAGQTKGTQATSN
jgi:hypothetical protein